MTKLNWGLIGGGEGSQIGPAHRLGAQADGLYTFTAGALDHNPEAGKAYARSLAHSFFYFFTANNLSGESHDKQGK